MSRRLRALLRKEWVDVRTHRTVWAMAVGMPVVMALTALTTTASLAFIDLASVSATDLPTVLPDGIAALQPHHALQAIANDQMLTFQMLMPVVVPLSIASFSIIDEKRLRSLEPLLASPVSTTELLLAKLLAAAVPGIAGSLACYLVCLCGGTLLNDLPVVLQLVRPTWLVAYLVVAPLLSLIAALGALMAASRFNDARVVQAVGSAALLPIFGASLGALMGWFVVDLGVMSVAALVLALTTAAGLRAVVALFDREAVLTRWK